ncbi:ribosome-associated translation inhibitor RaiA [Oleiharenicola lentus]|uniref:Ribosome-associated translation inhibitor RaiA n=2 Tax=Oleiharenicola lentus TaxID=2508720 RepID=A0A4Q1C7B5_9BACT|nr:ribosome-associated translation inhibitor RaiA [Oleiharenicola lentus]
MSHTQRMTHPTSQPIDETKFIIRGIHLDLTDALRRITMEKAARLLRHNDHILRIRLDLELDKTRGAKDQFIAKGRIEISGPDLIASVQSEDAYKSVDLLVDKLDALLRERHGRRKDNRNHPHAAELGAPLPKV